MSKLFEITEINGMKVKNRFVRSATWEGMAEDNGTCTPKLVDLMAKLLGLLFLAMPISTKEAKQYPGSSV